MYEKKKNSVYDKSIIYNISLIMNLSLFYYFNLLLIRNFIKQYPYNSIKQYKFDEDGKWAIPIEDEIVRLKQNFHSLKIYVILRKLYLKLTL